MNTSLTRSSRWLAFFLGVALLSSGGLATALTQEQPDEKIASMRAKLEATIIESVSLEQATLSSALSYLAAQVDDLQFVIFDAAASEGLAAKPITLSLRSVPASAVLGYVCRMTGCQFEVERDAVIVGSGSDIAKVIALRAARPQYSRSSAVVRQMTLTSINEIDFQDVPVAVAFNFLGNAIGGATDEAVQQIPNVVIVEDRRSAKPVPVASREVTVRLKNVSAWTAFGYINDIAGLSYRVDRRAVVVGANDIVSFRPAHQLSGNSALARQLAETNIAQVRFEGITFSDALEAIRYYSRLEGSRDALNVIDQSQAIGTDPFIHLHLDQVTLADLVNYVAEQSGTRVRVEQLALVFENDPSLAQRALAKQQAAAKPPGDSGSAQGSDENTKARADAVPPEGKQELIFD